MPATMEPKKIGLNVLTHSSESAFKACPRRFYYRYRLGLVREHNSDALRFGSAFHAGLEELKSGNGIDAAVAVIRDLYNNATCPPWLDVDEFRTEEETVIAMVRGYDWNYGTSAIVKYVAVEQSFDLPIVHPDSGRTHRMRTQGKMDGIAELADGRVALVEHKTTSSSIEPDSDYWRRLHLDSQISRYYLAARAMGYPIATVVYDVTRKPQIRPKAVAKADRALATGNGSYYGLRITEHCPEKETPTMFGARLLADIQSRPSHYFARMEIPRLQSDLDEFVRDQWHIASQVSEADRFKRFYRNTSACLEPYRCDYFDICKGFTPNPEKESPAGFKYADVLHPELAQQENSQ